MRSIRLLVLPIAAAIACFCAVDADAASPLFVVSGGGFGHGVGMSQYGAEGFALHGYRYQRILEHYYPGTRLSRVGNGTVRVLLTSGRQEVAIGSTSAFRVTDAHGRTFVLPAGARAVSRWFAVRVRKRRRLLAMPLRFIPGAAPLTLDGAAYRGSLNVSPALDVVNTVPLEGYLRGVVPAEMPSRWFRQALEAQAVAARSYALAEAKPWSGFDLYPDMRSQMYLGIGAERASTDAAVAATAGQVLTWHGAVAETYFYSSSGGRTAAPTDVWPGARPVPYLRSVEDPYDAISPYHQWRKQVLSTVQLATRLGLSGVRDVEAKPSRSGWVRAVLVRTSTGSRTLAAEDFARGLGLRSTFFRVGVLGLQASASSTVYGHGVLLHGLARGLRPRMEARRPGGAWRRVPLRAAVLNGEGWLRVRPTRATEYRLVAAGVRTAPVRVDVAPAVVVERRRRALAGQVAPGIAGLRVSVQRLLAGNWLTIRRARLGEGGWFRLSRGLPSGMYRARTTATSSLLAAASPPVRVP